MAKPNETVEGNLKKPDRNPALPTFILDDLLAFGAQLKIKHMDELRKRLPENKPEAADEELVQPYNDALREANQLSELTGSDICKEELRLIEKAVVTVKGKYWRKPNESSTGPSEDWDQAAKAFSLALKHLGLQVMTFSRAKTVMASYAYKEFVSSNFKFAFCVAWTELCRIKAAAGGHAAIRQDFANGMAVSSTYMRALDAATVA